MSHLFGHFILQLSMQFYIYLNVYIIIYIIIVVVAVVGGVNTVEKLQVCYKNLKLTYLNFC